MKIISVIKKAYEEIETDEEFLNVYLKFPDGSYYHKIDRNGGTYLRVNDTTNLENASEEWVRNQRKLAKSKPPDA